MDIQLAAGHLLALRLISSACLIWVLRKQLKLVIENNPPQEQAVRIVLLISTLIILVGNIIPIIVDVLTLQNTIERSTTILNGFGILYSYSNALTAALSGIAWTALYYLAERERVHLRHDNNELRQEIADLQK